MLTEATRAWLLRVISVIALFLVGAALGSIGAMAARGDRLRAGFDIEAWCGFGTYRTHFNVGQIGDHRPGLRVDIAYRSLVRAKADDPSRMHLALALDMPDGWDAAGDLGVGSPSGPVELGSWQTAREGAVLIPPAGHTLALEGRSGHTAWFIPLNAADDVAGEEVGIEAVMRDVDGSILERNVTVVCSSGLLPPASAG